MTVLAGVIAVAQLMARLTEISFYAKLGFDVGNSFTPPGDSEPSWAWLESGGANLMLTRASHPIDASLQAVIFCLYCEDVQSFWTALQETGLKVGEIEYPSYHPSGQFRLADPDGFDISVSQR
jgi:hypothetical protein